MTSSTNIKLRGVDQTDPKKGGNLRLVADMDGTGSFACIIHSLVCSAFCCPDIQNLVTIRRLIIRNCHVK